MTLQDSTMTRGPLTRVVGSRWPDPLVIVPRSDDFVYDLLLPRPEVSADGSAEGGEKGDRCLEMHVGSGEKGENDDR